MSASQPAHTNRLIREKSPYLQQHAQNPVDWYPWGPEAFEKAKRENKPILVSIGYSTCHWCHVMEHESYEDETVAALMNKHLVNIKVDREERPDVDRIYMTAVSAMTGSGGWPLNVFLTPDLKPFYGGTYFPPEARWGSPAWKDVVEQVGQAWSTAEHRQRALDVGDEIEKSLRQFAAASAVPAEALNAQWLDAAFASFESSFDGAYGGFSGAPKFPMPVNQHFLLRYYARTKNARALAMVRGTLDGMARGGIYDHLGGGFARYSVDGRWHVPHFEKMLYDNAQLALNYLETFQATGEIEYARVARETLDYVLRDMTHPDGGFFSAEDADSLPDSETTKKREGAFYVWGREEIERLLSPDQAALFCFRFGVRPEGNVLQDPHQEFTRKNVLYVAHSVEETARQHSKTVDEVQQQLERSRQALFEHRMTRPRPHLDDKVLSSWNGLMISAYCKGFQVLGDDRYLAAARRAADFVLTHVVDRTTGDLHRRWRDGDVAAPGTADDYAFMAQACIDLYETDFDEAWLARAVSLTDRLIRDFEDPAGGFFMTSPHSDPHLLVRVKEDTDNVEPCATSVAALNLLRLSQLLGRDDYEEKATKALKAFAEQMKNAPRALPALLGALDFALTEPRQVVLVSNAGRENVDPFARSIWKIFCPVKTIAVFIGAAEDSLVRKGLPHTRGMSALKGVVTAYVCRRHACQAPTSEPDEAARQLLD